MPRLTGMVRTVCPLTVTVIWWVVLLATAIRAGPILNEPLTSACPYSPPPRSRPYRLAFTLTEVPGFQYSLGRHSAFCGLNQCHSPTVGGSVVTCRSFCTVALSVIFSSKPTWMVWPTPYVERSLSRCMSLERRYGMVRLAGLRVVKADVFSIGWPSTLVAFTVTVYCLL